jgi:hypothetical protein
VAEAGLTISGFFRGYWSPGWEYDGGQDFFLVTKP